MKITSSNFEHLGFIPSQFTCDGENVSPELQFHDVPETAESLAIIMDDHDVPVQVKWDGYFDHWLVCDIPASTNILSVGDSVGVVGNNSRGEAKYTGPCPPSQYEPSTHHYNFRLLALDTMLNLEPGYSKTDLLHVAKGHVVAEHILTGIYKRN